MDLPLGNGTSVALPNAPRIGGLTVIRELSIELPQASPGVDPRTSNLWLQISPFSYSFGENVLFSTQGLIWRSEAKLRQDIRSARL